MSFSRQLRVVYFLVEIFSAFFTNANYMFGRDECWNLLTYSRIDRFSTTLVLDELVSIYHKYKNLTEASLDALPSREYTIDVTCLEHVKRIENTGRFVQSKKFFTGKERLSKDQEPLEYLKIEYKFSRYKSATAKVLIFNAKNIEAVIFEKSKYLDQIPNGAFSIMNNLRVLHLARDNDFEIILRQQNFLTWLSFRGLRRLTHLNMSGNVFTYSFHANFFVNLPQLTHLDLSHKAAEKLEPGAFNGLEKLQYLNLYDSGLDLGDDMFDGLGSLISLDLSFVNLTNSEAGLLFKLSNLTELVFINCVSFESEHLFNSSNNLERLDLSFSMYNFQQVELSSLRLFKKLKRLYLRNRRLNVSQIERDRFPDHLLITHLDLTSNVMTNEIFERLIFLEPTLESLVLDRNKIELLDQPVDIAVLFGLKELHLRETFECKLNVSHFLGMNNLKVLNLASSRINMLTVRSFVGLSHLEDLNLADNFIQTVENGTFVPLKSLERINLKGNQVKNLYFFGLGPKCAIHHDGLVSFNISFIDLSQMIEGRDQSFLQKILHLRGAKRLSIYRNIQVDWKSASTRPSCSLYLHVLRKYRVITFDIDDSYIDACHGEELETVSHRFHQEVFSNIVTLSPISFVRRTPPGIDFHETTSDGYLVGLSPQRTELVFVQIDNPDQNYSFPLADKSDDLFVLSDEFLVIRSNFSGSQTIWNMSNKSNVTLIVRAQISQATILLSNKYFVTLFTKTKGENTMCYIKIDAIADGFICQESPLEEETVFILLKGDFIVVREDNSKLFGVMNLVKRLLNGIDSSGTYFKLNTGHSEIISLFKRAPNGLLASQTKAGETLMWSVEGQNGLSLKRAMPSSLRGDLVFLKPQKRADDTFIANTDQESVVSIWSVRYGKQIGKISLQSQPKRVFSHFNRGLLVIDSAIYDF